MQTSFTCFEREEHGGSRVQFHVTTILQCLCSHGERELDRPKASAGNITASLQKPAASFPTNHNKKSSGTAGDSPTLHVCLYLSNELIRLGSVQKRTNSWKRVQDNGFWMSINILLQNKYEEEKKKALGWLKSMENSEMGKRTQL